MSVRDTAIKTIADMLGVNAADITDDSRFDEDLGADSLDNVELVLELELNFEIEISDADADAADTAGKLIALVERLVAGR